MTKIRITNSSVKRGWRWTYLSWHVHQRRSWLSECQPRKLITSRKQAGLAFEPTCCSSLACSSGLRWGRTLGTELPHLLVRSHMKSYMWCLIGGPCSHHCSHCHQSWPLDWEVTKGHIGKCYHVLRIYFMQGVHTILSWLLPTRAGSGEGAGWLAFISINQTGWYW